MPSVVPAPPSIRPRADSPLRRRAWPGLKLVLVVAATYWLAVPQIRRAWRGVLLLDDHGLALPVIGAVLAIAAVVSYAHVTRLLFEREERPGRWVTLGIVIAALGVNRLVPAGAPAGSIVAFRLFGRAGVSRGRAGFVMVAQGLGSNLLLVVLVALAMVATLPSHGLAPGYLTIAGCGALIAAAVIAVGDGVWHDRAWVRGAARAVGKGLNRCWSRFDPDRPAELVGFAHTQVRQLGSRRRDARSWLMWGLANWLLDAASLWVFLAVAGADIAPHTTVLVFGAANIAGLIPLTPGGLGVVDVTMTAALAGFGVPGSEAVAGVAGYRLSHYWLPIPAAACAYLLLRRHVARANRRPTAA